MKKIMGWLLFTVMLAILLVPCVALADDGSGVSVDFWTYITQESYVLIPVLYVVGYLIKKIPNVKDWVIPFGLLIIAIPLAMALSGWDIYGLIQGVLVTGVTVFANQLYKQGKERI